MRCLLVGNYGVGNWGDEALRERFLARFPDIDWVVTTPQGSEPGTCPRLPAGVRSFFALRWLRTLRLLRSVDAVLLGGGTLFTDIESPKACFLWWLHVVVPRLFGAPVLCAAQGIGPFRTTWGRVLAAHALRQCCFLSVRDEPSFVLAQHLGLSIKVVQSFDPVLLSLRSSIKERSQNVLVLIPRTNSTDSFCEAALRQAEAWSGGVRMLLFEPGPQEQAWAEDMRQRSGRSIEIRPVLTTAGLIAACDDAGRIVTQRFHGAIAALALGIPFVAVPQVPGDKLSRLPALDDGDALQRLRALAEEGENRLEEALRHLEAATVQP